MPTPSKPVELLEKEGKSHRTKKELQERKRMESSLLSGTKIKELKQVKDNEIAHKEFLRIKKLLEAINKNDELYSSSINRYCLLIAECVLFEERRNSICEQMDYLVEKKEELDIMDYIKAQDNIQKNIVNLDKQIQAKRRMMFDIEKENVMTIASSLRSIPKKQEIKSNPLEDALNDD